MKKRAHNSSAAMVRFGLIQLGLTFRLGVSFCFCFPDFQQIDLIVCFCEDAKAQGGRVCS